MSGHRFDKVTSGLSIVCGESAANRERSFHTREIIAETELNTQRPLRREAIARGAICSINSYTRAGRIPVVRTPAEFHKSLTCADMRVYRKCPDISFDLLSLSAFSVNKRLT
jgi:hypothetical protein